LKAFAAQSETQSIEEIETRLLLEAISLRYGCDVSGYAAGPLRRTISAGFAPASSRYQQVRDGVRVFRKVQ
jgi:hypothetical protein